MKFIATALVLGLALGTTLPAEAHMCADGHHRSHCGYQRHAGRHHHGYLRYSEVPPPPPGVVFYPPYQYYLPPTPASLFDVPPEYRLPANQLQWQMNAIGDRPFAEDTPY